MPLRSSRRNVRCSRISNRPDPEGFATMTSATRDGRDWQPEYLLAIDEKKCIGCGRCFKVCGRDVMTLKGLTDEGLFVDLDDDEDDEVEKKIMVMKRPGGLHRLRRLRPGLPDELSDPCRGGVTSGKQPVRSVPPKFTPCPHEQDFRRQIQDRPDHSATRSMRFAAWCSTSIRNLTTASVPVKQFN